MQYWHTKHKKLTVLEDHASFSFYITTMWYFLLVQHTSSQSNTSNFEAATSQNLKKFKGWEKFQRTQIDRAVNIQTLGYCERIWRNVLSFLPSDQVLDQRIWMHIFLQYSPLQKAILHDVTIPFPASSRLPKEGEEKYHQMVMGVLWQTSKARGRHHRGSWREEEEEEEGGGVRSSRTGRGRFTYGPPLLTRMRQSHHYGRRAVPEEERSPKQIIQLNKYFALILWIFMAGIQLWIGMHRHCYWYWANTVLS